MKKVSDRTIRFAIWILSILAVLFLVMAFYIPAKAMIAQAMLESAWQDTKKGTDIVKPWPWADTWPVARLFIPSLGIEKVVLNEQHGQSLAFGPGRHPLSAEIGEDGVILISAHRDTHFSFLSELDIGDKLLLEGTKDETREYEIVLTKIVSAESTQLTQTSSGEWLVLVTCYPFDSIQSESEYRYVVIAKVTCLTEQVLVQNNTECSSS